MGNHVCTLFSEAYPELQQAKERISRAILAEEQKFGQSFETALRQFDQAANIAKVRYIDTLFDGLPTGDQEVRHMYQNYLLPGNLEADKRHAAETITPGHVTTVLQRVHANGPPTLFGTEAFRLYDTFGLARDFISDLSRDAGVSVDWSGFDKAM